jgi:hypothetical protein
LESDAVRATASTGSRYSAATVKSTPFASAARAITRTSGNTGLAAVLCGVGYAAAAGFEPRSALSSTTKGARFDFFSPSLSPSFESAASSFETAFISAKKPSIWFMSR